MSALTARIRNLTRNTMLVMLCQFGAAESRTYYYQIKWQFVTIGEMTLTLSETPEFVEIAVAVVSRGPLAFLREYDARVVTTEYFAGGSTYSLDNKNRGAAETRFIRFERGKAPIVESFVEIDTPRPLAPSSLLDGHSMDPLRILYRLIRSVGSRDGCRGSYIVYDGKRRYAVEASSVSSGRLETGYIDEGERIPRICRAVLDGSTLKSASSSTPASLFTRLSRSFGFWPEKHEERILYVWLALGDQGTYVPRRFSVKTKVGVFVARLVGTGGNAQLLSNSSQQIAVLTVREREREKERKRE